MNTVDFNDSEAILEEMATEWLLEREEGFAPGRAEAFAHWRDGHPRHAAAVARVERTLALLDEMPAIRAPLEARVRPASGPRTSHFRRWAWISGMAAAVVIGASTWWMVRPATPAAQGYEVVDAEPIRVSLDDGSVVDLNANSRMEVRFTDGERRVTLVAGEAHFQVAPNPARPFIVTGHGVAVRAVGTAFNVRLVDGSVDVLVAEGKVAVARQDSSAFFATKTTPLVPLLVAGERTQVTPGHESTPRVEEMAPAQLRALLAWQNRMTSFVDVPLNEMIARINRCGSTQLVLGDPQLGERRVGGVIDLHQVGAFVNFLEQDGDIVSERTPTGEIVLRRAR